MNGVKCRLVSTQSLKDFPLQTSLKMEDSSSVLKSRLLTISLLSAMQEVIKGLLTRMMEELLMKFPRLLISLGW